MVMQDLTPILEVAFTILSEMKGKQGHVNDIAEQAVKRNLNLGLNQEELKNKLSSSLSSNIKRKNSIFSKVVSKKDSKGKPISYKRGVYRLKRIKQPKAVTINIAPPVDNAFLGKAGEMAVMSELLFWGFNASLMVVDKGIDIIASKDNKFYHLQVKTSQQKANERFGFTISTKSFDNNHSGNTYYIFVLRKPPQTIFAVIPSSHIITLRNRNIIKGIDNLSVSISILDNGRKYLLNSKDDITTFINNFGQII